VTDYTELAGRYIDAWNETDPTTRAALVKDLSSANARYTDPMAAAEGPEAITATIGAVQNQFPGFRFRLTGRPTATTTRSASPGSSAPAASPLRSSGSTLPSSAPTARSARSSGSSTASRRLESSNSRGVRRIGGPAAPGPEACRMRSSCATSSHRSGQSWSDVIGLTVGCGFAPWSAIAAPADSRSHRSAL